MRSWQTTNKVASFTEVIKSESPNLKTLVSIHTEIKVKAILTLKIESLIKFFNVGKNMGDTQIADTIDLILENYPKLKPDDIELCFKKAKSGQYGQLYDRLDGQVILGWIFKYTQAKDEFIEHNNYIFHQQKKLDCATPSTPEMRAAGIALLKKTHVEPLTKKEIENQREKSTAFTKKVHQTLTKDQEWLNLFDRIHRKSGKTLDNGTRYILRYGVSLTVTDFLFYKQKQFGRLNTVPKIIYTPK